MLLEWVKVGNSAQHPMIHGMAPIIEMIQPQLSIVKVKSPWQDEWVIRSMGLKTELGRLLQNYQK